MMQHYSKFPEAVDNKMQIVKADYGQFIIKPPEKNISHGRKSKRYVVDSRDRNTDQFPDPSKYILEIPDEYVDVISVEMTRAMIPHSGYSVNKNNNKIYFQETLGSILVAEVAPGAYDENTIDQLSNAITDALNKTGASKYTVKYDTLTRRFIISSDLTGGDHYFILNFYGGDEKYMDTTIHKYPPQSIGVVLGYPRNNFGFATGSVSNLINTDTVYGNGTKFLQEVVVNSYIRFDTNNTKYKVIQIISDTELLVTPNIDRKHDDARIFLSAHRATNNYDLMGEAYVILRIPEFHRLVGSNKNLTDAFTIMPLTTVQNKREYPLTTTFSRGHEIKFFNPPLARLQKITVEFRTHAGDLYDFNGLDHYMEFDIVMMNHAGRYNLSNPIS